MDRDTETSNQKLLAALAAAKATVAILEAELARGGDAAADEVLDLTQIAQRYGYGRDAITAAIARGELHATRGPRQRIQVLRSEIDRWRTSKPVRATRKSADVIDLASWEAEADRAMGGAR
jgi:hypothetical protein